MNDNLKDDLLANSNNILQKKQKRNLEIKIEDNTNDINHHEMQVSKTLSNINIVDKTDINENNSNKEEIAILEYKKRFNTLNQDEIENNNENNNNQKKKS